MTIYWPDEISNTDIPVFPLLLLSRWWNINEEKTKSKVAAGYSSASASLGKALSC
jgi:hypothetical protein